ncbi:MAG: enoyl-CoA hydratase/isomerase family protein [Candidatus Kariarchaeaceae archaeon]|jgi:enoyl-CoA hydratase
MDQDLLLETMELKFNTPIEKVVTLTFNRPNALNALNSQVIKEIGLAIDEIEKNKGDIRAVVVTGAGDKAFIAGADISEMVKLSPPEARNFLHSAQSALNRFEMLPLPVIAAINGYALGGGLEVALACDIRIASDKAVVGLPEVGLGLIPAAGGTQRLTRLIGVGQAKYLIMTAKRIKAEDALNRGIVSKVVPHDQLHEEVINLLKEMFKLGPIAIGAAKTSIQAALNEPINAGLEIELDEAIRCFMTKDLREGMTAFLEKRPADFKGK